LRVLAITEIVAPAGALYTRVISLALSR
jgi:hypothetical protein